MNVTVQKRAFTSSHGTGSAAVYASIDEWSDHPYVSISITNGYDLVNVEKKEFDKIVKLVEKTVAAFDKKVAAAEAKVK